MQDPNRAPDDTGDPIDKRPDRLILPQLDDLRPRRIPAPKSHLPPDTIFSTGPASDGCRSTLSRREPRFNET